MITATESRRNAHPERPPRRGVARRGSCLVLVAAIGVSMGGCGLFTRNSPTVRGPRVEPRTPAVIVLEHGAGPRRPLRFDLPVGTETEVELRVDLHLTQHGDDPTGTTRPSDRDQPAGRAVVIDPPATYQQVRFTVTGADSSGHDVEFEVVDAGVELEGTILTDVQAVELTAEVQQLVGVRGGLRLDRRGAVRSVTFAPLPTTALTDDPDARARTEAQLREVEQQLTSVVPQLPSEPVGRGARWRTAGRSALAGTALRQTTTYEITAIDGDVIIYRATISQSAGEQALETATNGPTAAGDDTRLLAAELTGTTNGRVSLVSLASEHETRLVGSQLIDVDGDPPARVRQELDLVVSAGPPPS